MLSQEVVSKKPFATHRGYRRIVRGVTLRGFEPVGITASRIPKYIDAPARDTRELTGASAVIFGIVEVFFSLVVILCLLGFVAVGVFVRGR